MRTPPTLGHIDEVIIRQFPLEPIARDIARPDNVAYALRVGFDAYDLLGLIEEETEVE